MSISRIILFISCIFCVIRASSFEKTETQRSVTNVEALTVNDSIRERFEHLHKRWYEACEASPKIMMSSQCAERTKLSQFDDLVNMGSTIIPLIIEKMTKDKYFFSYLVYESIQTDKKMLPKADDISLDDVEARARFCVEKWFESMNK